MTPEHQLFAFCFTAHLKCNQNNRNSNPQNNNNKNSIKPAYKTKVKQY